jgi:hemerythrin
MEWQDKFKIGISVIDAQHKQLFLAKNELNEALAKGLRPAAIDRCLTQVGFYVARHFAMEEQYMEASSYPGLAEQILAHRYFTKRFTEIKEEFQRNGLSPSVVNAIQNELGLWLKNHVLGLDQDFGAYYKENKA